MTFEAITVEIAKLTLAPGDVVVLKVNAVVTDDVRVRLAENISGALPGIRVLVLDRGCDLSALTKAEIEARL